MSRVILKQIRIGFRFYQYRCLRYYSLDIGFIVALSAGIGIPIIIVVLIALFCICRRRKNSPDRSAECSSRHLTNDSTDGLNPTEENMAKSLEDLGYLRPQMEMELERRSPESQEDHLYTEAIFADDTGYLRPVEDETRGPETVPPRGGREGRGVVVRGSDRATYYPPHSWCPNREPEKMEDGLGPEDPTRNRYC